MRKAVIIIPTYNEAKNINNVVEKIFQVQKNIKNWDLHVLVVDSDSPDNTTDIVGELAKNNKNLHLLKTDKKGLGKAYVEGFNYVIDTLKPFIVFEIDADLSHNPQDIPSFLNKIEKGADFVIGSRYISGGSIPEDWGIERKFFSVFGNWIIRFGFMNLRVTDWTNGFRAIKTWIIKESLPKLENYTGYVFQVALLDNALKMGARVSEIPVVFVDRREGESKINSGQYTFETLLYIFQYSSFIKFVIVGVIGFTIDFGISYLFIEIAHTAVWLSTLISTEMAIISNFLLNNFWSFSHKKLKHGENNFLWSFFKFNLVSSGSIIIQTLGVSLATAFFGREFWYIYKIAIITFIIIPYSYILYNKLIWKDK